MNNSQQQRKNLSLLIIAVLFFIYTDKVLIPYLNPTPEKTKVNQTSDSTNENVNKSPKAINQENQTAKLNKNHTQNSTEQEESEKNLEQKKLNEQSYLENQISLETPLIEAKISPLGGRITSLKLKGHKSSGPNDPELYNMISHRIGTNYPGGIIVKNEKGQTQESDLETTYQANIENDGLTINLAGSLPSGSKIKKTFVFNKESFLFDVKVSVDSSQKKILAFEWLNEMPALEASLLDSYNVVGFVWLKGDIASREQIANMKAEKTSMDLSCVRWVGVGDKYFASAIISEKEVPLSQTTKDACEGMSPQAYIKNVGEVAHISFTPIQNTNENSFQLKVFSGPKSYKMLKETGYELKRLVDLGSTGFISAPLLSFLNFFYGFVGNYGLAIVLLTICVKLCLYPLNTTQYRQMKALQALKPEMDRIKDTIKDKQQQQLAMMDLYKKKGVNPLGGCLPALIQMPIFIGLYSALMLAVELRHAPYGMWVHDLSSPDKLMVGGIGIPVLVVLFTLSIMVQQWITPSNMDETQKKVMMIMPVVMFFMFMNFPAGLALYWLTNNLISIGQQEAIKYGDKSGKSGLSITIGAAIIVFIIAYICTLI